MNGFFRFLGATWWAMALIAALSIEPARAQLPSPSATPAATPAPTTAPIDVKTYRAQLRAAAAELQKQEKQVPHRLDSALKPLLTPRRVRRADGEIQDVDGDEWQRRLDDAVDAAANANTSAKPAPKFGPKATPTPFKFAPIPPLPPPKPNAPINGSRAETRDAHRAVELRLKVLEEWTRPAPKYFQGPDAQKLFASIEAGGQIRTGPTASQQWWADVGQWVSNTWAAFVKWLEGLFPTSSRPASAFNFDPRWVEFGFYLAVGALLVLIGFVVWRAIGGRWRRGGAQREIQLAHEDAELLRLPPDELAERAARFAGEGNFREALRHLYLSLLLHLDARDVWRYDTRRTNWEHIAALRGQWTAQSTLAPLASQSLELLSGLTRRFDRVRYGNAACDAEQWNGFQNDANRVREAVPQLPRTAARQASKAPPTVGKSSKSKTKKARVR